MGIVLEAFADWDTHCFSLPSNLEESMKRSGHTFIHQYGECGYFYLGYAHKCFCQDETEWMTVIKEKKTTLPIMWIHTATVYYINHSVKQAALTHNPEHASVKPKSYSVTLQTSGSVKEINSLAIPLSFNLQAIQPCVEKFTWILIGLSGRVPPCYKSANSLDRVAVSRQSFL